jgi:hypothetical protein
MLGQILPRILYFDRSIVTVYCIERRTPFRGTCTSRSLVSLE